MPSPPQAVRCTGSAKVQRRLLFNSQQQIQIGQHTCNDALHKYYRLLRDTSPHEIACRAIRIDTMPPHASLRFAFDLVHRLIDAVAKGREYPIIHPHQIRQRHAFGQMEIEIVPDGAITVRPQRQSLS